MLCYALLILCIFKLYQDKSLIVDSNNYAKIVKYSNFGLRKHFFTRSALSLREYVTEDLKATKQFKSF